jgi:hypothetical protein
MRTIVRKISGRRLTVSLLVVALVGLAGCFPAGPGPGRCAPPSYAGWNHYETQYTSGFRPAANWPVSDGNNSTTVSSPTGSAMTGLAFAPDFGQYGNVDGVANSFFNLGSVTNIQVVSASAPYQANGGIQRDYEFTGVNRFELLEQRPVRGRLTALHVATGPGAFGSTWLEMAYADIFEGVCGTLRAIRSAMFRKTQPPAGGFGAAGS